MYVCITYLHILLEESKGTSMLCIFVIDEGSVRLSDGAVESEGRVEVYLGGQWGTVCDDLFGLPDANVVCNQLGYLGAMSVEPRTTFGFGGGAILLDDVRCVGNESRLVDCPRRASGHDCGHHEDVGVRCNPCPLGKF